MEFNCTPPAVEEFPNDLFSKFQLENGAVVVHILVTIYLFTAIAIVCDEYFVPVVERICHIFHVPPDIGGATFMAAATSSPELFVNIVGTFVTEGDIGLGTIVGSAVFNILAVPACCGLTLAMNRTKLKLDWWPLTRDSLIYGISICLLIGFLNDEKILWYEAMTLVLVYVAYLIFLFFDKHIQKYLKELLQNSSYKTHQTSHEKSEDSSEPNGDFKIIDLTMEKDVEIKIENDLKSTSIWCTSVENKNYATENYIKEGSKKESEEPSLWQWPSEISRVRRVIWVINWPINAVFFLTVPNCEKVKSNKWIPVAFVMCIMWIGVLSYILSWMITVIGDILKIPDSIMGISFLAIGAGVPEAASSIIVVKKGKGAMGISNSLGSNTFDILLCLGVPWLLKSTVVSSQNWVNIHSSGLQYSAIILLITLLAFYLALVVNKFKLDKWVGLYTVILYLIFLVLASLIELNVFFQVNLPSCR